MVFQTVKDKFKELVTPDLPHIALSGFLNLLSELPGQFDVTDTLYTIANSYHDGTCLKDGKRFVCYGRTVRSISLKILKRL